MDWTQIRLQTRYVFRLIPLRFVVALFVVWLSALQAQGQADASERRYRNGVRLYQQGKYDLAKAELLPLIQRRTGGTAPYAHYYHALADLKLKRYAESRQTLRQLLELYPDWKKNNEVYYLLGAVYLESRQYEQGLEQLARISDLQMKADVNKLESYHLNRIDDLKQLKQLQKEFPENRNVALALIDLIQRTSTDRSDLELSDKLSNRFGVPVASASTRPTNPEPAPTTTSPSTPPSTAPQRNRNKGYYNVGVLFPFRLNELDVEERARSNQYVIDLYNGMRMARSKLQSEGITVNLFAYDVDRDPARMSELLQNASFQQNDLLFGPLYAEPNRMAVEYATRMGITLVNPISTSNDLIASQPNAFLAQPSLLTQAQRVMALARTFSGPRKAAIYYGSARKDSLLAATYQSELKRQGYQVLEMKEIVENTDDVTLSELNRPGHVFLSYSDEKSGPRLLQTLSRLKMTGPVVATASGFDFLKNSLSTFNRSNLYLLYPDFVDTQRPEVEAFNETYLTQYNIIPSTYAYQGYDMLLFFGRMLARNRGQLPARSTMVSDTSDYMLSGFSYINSNGNQIVPIVQYDEGRFVIKE